MSASAADMGDSAAVVNASDAFVNEMMQLLDSDNLRALKQHFGKYKDELDIYTFVSVMRQFLPKKAPLAADPATLVANLKELFEQVDVNGDQLMEWAELTSFIVESQHAGALRDGAVPHRQVEPIQDQTRLRSEQTVERLFYLDALDALLLCERPAPTVSVYSPKASACVHELKGHSAEVLAVEHVPEAGVVVTSGADLTLCFWDAAGGKHATWKLRQRASVQHSSWRSSGWRAAGSSSPAARTAASTRGTSSPSSRSPSSTRTTTRSPPSS